MFVVDDVAIGLLIAALAAGGTGLGFLTKSKGLPTFKNSKGEAYKMDGALSGIDPPGTLGHNTAGYPVNKEGFRIVTDGSAFERLDMSSYQIASMISAIQKSTDLIIGTPASKAVFGMKYPKSSPGTAALKNKLKSDPKWVKAITDAVFGSGSGFENWSGSEIAKDFGGKPKEIADFISKSANAQKKLLGQLKGFDPSYNIPIIIPKFGGDFMPNSGGTQIPGVNEDNAKSKTVSPTDIPTTGGVEIPGGLPSLPGLPGSKLAPTTGGSAPIMTLPTGGGGKTAIDGGKTKPDDKTKTKTDTDEKTDDKEGPKKKKPEDEEPKPKPVPLPKESDSEVVEKLINRKPARPKKPVQWYPTYNMGGQDILKLTDTEKLEEMKNWSLFDLVSPLLEGDSDNLLNLQNQMKQNLRFQNNYPNPAEPPKPVPLPNTNDWRYPMQSSYPTPYPMRLDTPQSNRLYYDRWGNPVNLYLNQRLNMASGLDNCDVQQILNSQSKGFTAIDPHVAKSGGKFSLLEGLDSSAVSQLDIQLCKMY
jgi:hypothetical protein